MKDALRRLAKTIVERFPKLARTYRQARDNWDIDDEPRNTAMGFKFAGNVSMQDGHFEPDETRLVKQIVSNVDVVVNVGANIGYYCCIALESQKYVVAFEPIHRNLQVLLRNIKANAWEARIEVFAMALSDSVGVIEMFGGGTGASLVKGWAGGSDQYSTWVPCSTLDNVLGARFQGQRCLVIVDIEGAEHGMLLGANSFLHVNPRPIWMVEISMSEHQPAGVKINPTMLRTFEIFEASGYDAFTADGPCRVIHIGEVEAIVASGADTLKTHNFLFIEKGKKSQIL